MAGRRVFSLLGTTPSPTALASIDSCRLAAKCKDVERRDAIEKEKKQSTSLYCASYALTEKPKRRRKMILAV